MRIMESAKLLQIQLAEDFGVPSHLEYQFDTTGRKWRFDLAILAPRKIAVEIDGGNFARVRGAHARAGSGRGDQLRLAIHCSTEDE
jgi:hypothetical protein